MRKTSFYYEEKRRRRRERRHGGRRHRRHHHHHRREQSFDSYPAPPHFPLRTSFDWEEDEYELGYDSGNYDPRFSGKSSRRYTDGGTSYAPGWGKARARSFDERYDSRYSFPPPRSGPFGKGPNGYGGYDPRGYDRGFGGAYGGRYFDDHPDERDPSPFEDRYGRRKDQGYADYRHRDRHSYVLPSYEPRSDGYCDRGGYESPPVDSYDNRKSRYPGSDDYGRHGGFGGGRYGGYERPFPDSDRYRGHGDFDARSDGGHYGHYPNEDEYSDYSDHDERYPRPPPSGRFGGGPDDGFPGTTPPEDAGDGRTHYEVLGVSPDVDQAT